jgi:hypothetical protein
MIEDKIFVTTAASAIDTLMSEFAKENFLDSAVFLLFGVNVNLTSKKRQASMIKV